MLKYSHGCGNKPYIYLNMGCLCVFCEIWTQFVAILSVFGSVFAVLFPTRKTEGQAHVEINEVCFLFEALF